MRSSLARARRSAPKERRRAQRKRVRPVKQACSDTIEKTISSTREIRRQRKRARFYKGSSLCPIIHTMTDTSLHLHITTVHCRDSSSQSTMHHERGIVYWSVLHCLQLKTDDNHEPVSPRRRVFCWTKWATAGTLEFVSERPIHNRCKKDWVTESGWEVASADVVAPSWSRSWNMRKPAAQPKPRECTMHVFMP